MTFARLIAYASTNWLHCKLHSIGLLTEQNFVLQNTSRLTQTVISKKMWHKPVRLIYQRTVKFS